MAQYRTGTATFTNGSQVVTGTGTSWLSSVSAGSWIVRRGSSSITYQAYEVGSVDSDTQITLTDSYAGDTAADAEYVIHIDFLANGAPRLNNGDVNPAAIMNRHLGKTINGDLLGSAAYLDQDNVPLTLDSIEDIPDLNGYADGQKFNVTGYYSGTTVGGGTFAKSTGRHDGVIYFDPGRVSEIGTSAYYVDSGSDAVCLMRVLENGVIVDMSQAGVRYGSSSYGVSNQAAIQAYVDGYFSLSGGFMPFSAGDVYYTGSITIPFSVGWLIAGAGRRQTNLIQTADNTPHLNYTSDLTHSWNIRGIRFTWENQQTSSDTLAKGMYFDSSTSSTDTDNFFLLTLDDIAFANGYELFGTNESNNNLIWGIQMPTIVSIENTTVGRAFSAIHGGSGGQPSNVFGYLYIGADNMTRPVIETETFNFVAEVIEILAGSSYPALSMSEGEAHITQLKCEAWYPNSDMAGRGVIEKVNTGVNISEFKGDFRALDVGIGNYFYLMKTTSTPNGDDYIGKINIDPAEALVSGNPVLLSNSGELGTVTIRAIQSKTDFTLSDTSATDAASYAKIDEYANGRMSADNGDADVVLDFGDATTQQFNTTLTAARTITLPGPRTGLTDCFNGLKYTIIRNATTPGAFTLSIAHDGGTTFVIPSNTNMIVEYTFRRNAWVLTNKVTL